ncbi:MAG: hypothetical protein JNN08_29905 [Bryobacterales bacterium]|nr:hypothetical protein [Bryobacterales bacterium]
MGLPVLLALVACAPGVISRPVKPGTTAQPKLVQQIALPAQPSAATVLEGRVFAAAGDRVYYLDGRSGCERWSFQAGAPIATNIVIAAVRAGRYALLFADTAGQLYAVDMDSKRVVYQVALPGKPAGAMTYRDMHLYVPTEVGTVSYLADLGTEASRSKERPTSAPRSNVLADRDGFRVAREGSTLLISVAD